MTNLKAIVLDLDGTLLNGVGEITAKTKVALQNLRDSGTKIILATGRPVNMTQAFHQELGLETPMICLNGAVVFDDRKNKVMSYEAFEKEELDRINNIVSEEAKVVLYHTAQENYQMKNVVGINLEDYYPIRPYGYVPSEDEPILKLSAYIHEEQKREESAFALKDNYQVAEWPDNIEITKKNVTKWHSLQYVLEHLHIDVRDTIAFGDGSNDIEMIKHVGCGVAMGNAIPQLVEVADVVTATNEEDGIFDFLSKHVVDATLLSKVR